MVLRDSTSSLRRVRTFQDDVRRARGEAEPQAAPVLSQTAPPSAAQIGRTSNSADTNLPQAPLKRVAPVVPRTVETTPRNPAPTPVRQSAGESRLDIRTAASGIEEATIITDRKKHSWSIWDALEDAISKWWEETMATVSSEREMPRVAPASRRATIIKAAGVESKLAPQSEHKAIVEKLRASKAPVETENFVLTQPAEATPSWTYTTGTEGSTDNVLRKAVESMSQKRPRLREPAPIHVEDEVAVEPKLPPYRESAVQQKVPDRATQVQSFIPPQPQPEEPTQKIEEVPAEPPVLAPEPPPPPPPPPPSESKEFADRARARARSIAESRAKTTTTTPNFILYVGGGVALMLAIALISGLVYYITSEDTPTEVLTTENDVPILFPVAASESVPLPNDRLSLLSLLSNRVAEATGTQNSLRHWYLSYANDPKQQPLPTVAFTGALGLRAPGAFLRTLDPVMMFGAHIQNPNAPYLVFKVRNSKEAFGGMLEWEKYLNADLAPLFGEDLSITEGRAQFVDEIIGGRDTRSLYSEDGTLVLLYSFVDAHTIAITTSRATLVTLIEVLSR